MVLKVRKVETGLDDELKEEVGGEREEKREKCDKGRKGDS